MRIFSARIVQTAIAAAGALLAVALPVAAQTYTTASTHNPAFTVRLGGFFTSNSAISHSVGSSFICGGLDYDIKQQVGTTRTIASVDYITRSSGGSNFRMYPLTIGQMIIGNTHNGVAPYYGLGLGAYFINENITGGNSQDYATFGGYAAVGVEYDRYLVLDARYHLVTSSHGVNPDGLELTAGLRF